nr:MAG TPA: hypothetical protein [Caudoviricetes sp.]
MCGGFFVHFFIVFLSVCALFLVIALFIYKENNI